MKSVYSKYLDLGYFIKFLVIYLVLDNGNYFMIGLTTPEGMYVPFTQKYLNYPDWTIQSILYTSRGICSLFGFNTNVSGPYLQLVGGHAVKMAWPCIGFGMMSFWAAFILAHQLAWKSKLKWTVAGIISIWFVNCWRVALILIAQSNTIQLDKYLDHHAMFNIASYIVIGLLLMLWYKRNKEAVAGLQLSNPQANA